MAPAIQTKPRRRLETWAAVTVAFIGAVFFATVCSSMLAGSRSHDFLGLYTAGVIAKTNPSQLYDPDVQLRVEQAQVPGLKVLWPFPRPAFISLAFIPLAWMPIETAFVVWIVLGIIAAIAIWYWAFRWFGSEALVFCSFFIPIEVGIASGQDTAFLTGIVVLAYWAAERARPFLCGLLLALVLEKFHLFLLVPVMLLIRREWKILAGFIPGAAVVIGISMYLASPQSYLAFLTNSKLEALNPSTDTMFNLRSIAVNFGIDYLAVRIVLSLAVLAAVILIPRSAPFSRWFWAAIGGSLLISPHTYGYDAAVLLVPILAVLIDPVPAPVRKWIAAIAALPFPYFATLLPQPYSAAPAIMIVVLFLSIAWPAWFDRKPFTVEPKPSLA